MKKIISTALALIMLASTIPVTMAKTYNAEKAKNLLVGLGIMESYDLEPEESITRSEFAHLAVNVMNKSNEAANYSGSKFNDVTEDDENYSEIYYLDSLDIMVGDGNGNFNPYDKLILQDAVKAVVTMLNYDVQAKSKGGYPTGYMSVASELALTDGISLATAEELTAEDAIILLANALSTEMLQQIFESDRIVYKAIDNETLMYKAFDCIRGEGLVSANSKTTLETEEHTQSNTVVIGGNSFNAGTTDIESMLGYYVEYYAVENDDKEFDIVAYEISEKKNEVLEIDAGDIDKGTTEAELVYEVDNKIKRAKIATGADVIYNGVAKLGLKKWQLMPDSGKVTLFNTDNDKDYEIVKVDSYINYVLKDKIDGEYIFDKYNQTPFKWEDEAWEEKNIYLNGKPVTSDELKANDILSIRADAEKTDENGYREIDFDNAKYIDIYASREQVSGKIEQSNTQENTITIGLQEYRFSQNFVKAASGDAPSVTMPKTGANITAMLDVNGLIAAVDISGFSQYGYGYLIKTIKNTDEEPVQVIMKIYTGSGIMNYTCREKIRVDGVSGKAEFFADDFIDKPQLIFFKTNSDGFITDIDTGTFNQGKEDKQTSLRYKGSYVRLRYSKASQILVDNESGEYERHICYVDGNTKILQVPSKTDILNGNYTENDFGTIPLSQMTEYQRYDMDVYNCSDSFLAEYAVVKIDNGNAEVVTDDAKRIMVDKVSFGLTEDEEIALFVDGYYYVQPVKYSIKKKSIIDKIVDGNGKFLIKRGDIIRSDINTKNEMTTFSLEVPFSEDIGNKHINGGNIYGAPTSLGVAYSKDSKTIVMRMDAQKLGTDKDVFNIYRQGTDFKVTLYDAVDDRISIVDYQDILCETEVGDKAYILYVKLISNGEVRDVVAYKLK